MVCEGLCSRFQQCCVKNSEADITMQPQPARTIHTDVTTDGAHSLAAGQHVHQRLQGGARAGSMNTPIHTRSVTVELHI